MNSVFFAAIGLFFVANMASSLDSLVFEGYEAHPLLVTKPLSDRPVRHVRGDVVKSNPQLSSDAEFIRAIAASGSQGRLDGEGVHSALYALYVAERETGLYGLEAASAADADSLEESLREVWSHNESIGRARVHRRGLILIVVWNDGVSREIWDAINASVTKRLNDAVDNEDQ